LSEFDKKQWVKKRGALPVADLVSKLLDPVIERRAGMTLDLIASWTEIVGEHHASRSRPEKLHWPRQISDDNPFEPATLIVACEGGHALYLQHDTGTVIERINSYFGFAAVAKLKLVQKPLPVREQRRRQTRKPVEDAHRQKVSEILDSMEEGPIKDALQRMGEAVFSKGS